MTDMDDSDARCASEKISHLWELAVTRSGNPELGITKLRRIQPATFDVLGYAMMSSPDLRVSLECLVRYLRIVSDAITVRLSEESDNEFAVDLHILSETQAVPRQRVEFDFLTLMSFLRWISGDELTPLRMEFSYPPPDCPQKYYAAFGCPLQFSMPRNRLILVSSDLLLPLPACNSELSKFHSQFAVHHIKRMDEQQISFRVQELIISRLPGGEPRREDIAGALCLGPRTLQRRLQGEGTSFLSLLDETRCELARQYLEQRRLSVGEMTYMLGFADQGTFFRSCKRWFGVSPKTYRTHHHSQ